MNKEHKERLIKLLGEYCDEHGCTLIEDTYHCNENCRFDYCIEYCPVLYIRYKIKREIDRDELRT